VGENCRKKVKVSVLKSAAHELMFVPVVVPLIEGKSNVLVKIIIER
jgi:hypothetical protein